MDPYFSHSHSRTCWGESTKTWKPSCAPAKFHRIYTHFPSSLPLLIRKLGKCDELVRSFPFPFSLLSTEPKPKSYTHTHTHASESIRFSCKYRARCALAPEQSKAGRLFGIATYNAVLFRGVWLRCQLLTLTARARYLDETLAVRVATLFTWSLSNKCRYHDSRSHVTHGGLGTKL